MGAIESLLGIVDMKNASGLVLATGEVPLLLVAGGRTPLTMPPLSSIMMEQLLADVLSAEQRAALRSAGSLDAGHRSAAHGPFIVQARFANDKLTVTVTRGTYTPPASARPPAAAEPPSSVRAVPAFESAPSQSPAPQAADAVSRAVSVVLEQASGRGASDVLFSASATPLLRVDGELLECRAAPPLTSEGLREFFMPHVPEARRDDFERTGSVDFAFVHRSPSGPEVRYRVNLFRHERGVSAALRPLWTEVPSLAELHLPASLVALSELRHGLVLVSGATGSGKSTTLAALLEHVNRTRAAHIVTLEDPIEYVYRQRRSVIHQRELGLHVDSFASGLRAALRENPDVLLVGELRDAATIRLALTAAQTGHLVLATLHSGSAVMAVERLLDGFSESEKLHVRQEVAATLRHVVAQQLVPATAGGRVPALELLTVNHAVAAQLREGRTHMLATQMELGAEDGMVSMPRALSDLVRSGRVTRASAFAACDDREALERLLEERPAPRAR